MLLAWGCGDDGTDSGTGAATGGHHNEVPPALTLTGDPVAGEGIFDETCGASTCHGPDGSGGSKDAEDLGEVVPMLSDTKIVNVMEDGYLVMPPQRLEDQQMADVLAYLRQEWGG